MRLFGIALALSAVTLAGAAVAQEEGAGPRGGGMGMMRADANGDGVITRAEYQAQVEQRFARLDANGNGTLDAGEGPGPGRGRMRGDNGPPPPPPGGSAGDAPPPPPPPAAGMTRDQFRALAMNRFNRLDANGDGKIDATEMQAMGAGRGPRPEGPPPQ